MVHVSAEHLRSVRNLRPRLKLFFWRTVIKVSTPGDFRGRKEHCTRNLRPVCFSNLLVFLASYRGQTFSLRVGDG